MLKNAKQNATAGIYMAAGTGAYTANDVFLKLLAQDIPIFQALFLRGLITTTFFGILIWPKRQILSQLPRKANWLLAIRSMAEALAAFFFVQALLTMPIANLTAVMYIIPLSTAFFAHLVLREPLGGRRLTAIFFGFSGVLLITRPGVAGFTALLLPLATVIAITVRDLTTRMTDDSIPSLVLVFYGSLGVTVFSMLGSINHDWVALSVGNWGWLLGAALFIACGYGLIIHATRFGELTFIAPFRYSSIIFALIAGWFVFQEWPDNLAFIGCGIALASALYALARETTHSR